MSGNPIIGKDLYQSDGSLEGLLKLFQAIDNEIQQIPKHAADIETAFKKIQGVRKADQKAIEDTAVQTEKLIRYEKALVEAKTDVAKKIEVVKNQTAKQTAENRAAAKAVNAVKDSYNDLSAQLSVNLIKWHNLTKAERENTQAGRDLTKEIRRQRDELKTLDAQTGTHVRNVGNYKSALGGVITAARQLVATYLSLSAAQRLVDTVFNQTKALDGLKIAFQQVIGSTEGAAKAQAFLSDMSERLGVDLLGVSRSYLKFIASAQAAGLEQGTTNQIFESFAKVGSSIGLTGAEMERVFRALDQMLAKNVVSSEELKNQLGDVLPAVYSTFAKSVGLTTQELGKQLKAGNILAKDTLPKFAKEMEVAFGVDKVNTVDNLAAAQGRFNRSVTLLIETLDSSGAFKSFFDTLTSGVNFIKDNLAFFGILTKGVITLGLAWGTWKLAILAANAAQSLGLPIIQRAIAQKGFFTTATVLATRAQVAFNAALRLNPLGLFTTGLVLAITLLSSIKAKASDAGKSLSALGSDTAKNIQASTREFNGLIGALNRLEPKSASRKVIIDQINQQYKEYLPNLLTEKSTLEEIAKAQEAVNTKLKEKAFLETFTKSTEPLRNSIAEVSAALHQAEIDQAKFNEAVSTGNYELLGEQYAALRDAPTEAGREFNKFLAQGKSISGQDLKDFFGLDTLQKQLKEKEDAFRAIAKRLGIAFDDLFKTATDTSGGGGLPKDLEKEFNDFIERRKELNALMIDGRDKELDSLDIFFLEKKNKYKNDQELLIALELDFQRRLAEIQSKYKREKVEIASPLPLANAAPITESPESIKARKQAELDAFLLKQELTRLTFENEKHSTLEVNRFKLDQEIELYKMLLKIHNEGGEQLSEAEIKRYKALIPALLQIKNELVPDEAEDVDLFSLLGITLDDDKKQAISDAFAFAKSQVQEWMALQREAAEEEIRLAQDKVAAAKEFLATEMENRRAGYADRVATAQKELAQAKKQEAEAIKRQQKHQRAQIALNSALEASNLALAIANILGKDGIPFPFSLIAVATMLGAFAVAKVKAIALTKRTFRKGGYETIDSGGSHESGNDTYVGSSRGKDNYAEKGESVGVFNPKATKKYKPALREFVQAANNLKLDAHLSRQKKMSYGIPLVNNHNVVNVNTSRMEQGINKIVKNTSGPDKYRNAKGQLVEDYGSTKITYIGR
jgi:tape measure domain-containing protein